MGCGSSDRAEESPFGVSWEIEPEPSWGEDFFFLDFFRPVTLPSADVDRSWESSPLRLRFFCLALTVPPGLFRATCALLTACCIERWMSEVKVEGVAISGFGRQFRAGLGWSVGGGCGQNRDRSHRFCSRPTTVLMETRSGPFNPSLVCILLDLSRSLWPIWRIFHQTLNSLDLPLEH